MPQPTPRRTELEPAFLGPRRHSQEIGVHRVVDGPVTVLDAESLRQPIELPHSEYRRLYFIVGIAVALALLLVGGRIIGSFVEQISADAQVQDIIEAAGPVALPPVTEYAGKSNDEITAAITEAGFTIHDNSSEEDWNAEGFDYILVPEGVSSDTVAAAYASGLSQLSGPAAAEVLVGSWRLLVNRSNGNELRLRYIDFTATSPNQAIENALATLGLEPEAGAKPTPDTLGNTNISGTFSSNDTSYPFTISTCDLEAIYDISGLPADAQYVGVKITW